MTEPAGLHIIFGALSCDFFPLHYLGADAEMWVGDELGLIVAVVLGLQESIQHAHSDSRQSHQEAQQLPGLH